MKMFLKADMKIEKASFRRNNKNPEHRKMFLHPRNIPKRSFFATLAFIYFTKFLNFGLHIFGINPNVVKNVFVFIVAKKVNPGMLF